MEEQSKTVCPFCHSAITVRLANETHCNQCGRSWGLDKNPVSTMALARKARRSRKTGWPSNPGASGT